MIIEEILEKLKEMAETYKLNKYKEIRSLYMKFKVDHEGEVKRVVDDVLGKYIRDGETIEMHIKSGLFVDMGMETIRIRRGVIWEYYHYPSTTHYYIRLLYLSNSVDWIALYADENPSTAWWTEEERRVE